MEVSSFSKFCDLCQFSEFQGIIFCKNCFRNRTVNAFLYEVDQITNKIFLGNEEGAKNIEQLKFRGISHILICGVDLIKFYPEEFIYYTIEIEDSPDENILKHFSKTLKFIQSAKKIYVHCWAGVSRSASFVIAYLIWQKKISFEQAFEEVKLKRNCINPNEGFIKQLNTFYNLLVKNDFKLNKIK